MSWLLAALFGRLSFAICNILDGHFRVGIFKDSFCQTFFFGIYLTILLALFYCFNPVEILDAKNLLLAFIAGISLSLHAIPYLSSLKKYDTSTVVSLFTLGRVFVPILAFFIANEYLSWNEILGFGITLLGALWHAYERKKANLNFELLFKMFLSGIMIATFSVFSKILFTEISLTQGLFHIYIFDTLISLGLILIPSLRPNIIHTLKNAKSILLPYSSTVFFALLGHSLSFYAISITKVTYVAMTAQFQAFLTLMVSLMIQNLNGFKHNESLKGHDIVQKVIGFVIMAIGMGVALLVS